MNTAHSGFSGGVENYHTNGVITNVLCSNEDLFCVKILDQNNDEDEVFLQTQFVF